MPASRRPVPSAATPPASPDGLAARYDAAILDPATRDLYDGTGLYNVGDWADGPRGLGEASRRLVRMHLDVDTAEEAQAVSVVLDIGCGLGAGAAMMAEHYPRATVVGINFSPLQAAWGAEAAPRARFAVMDATRLAVGDGVADRIHSIEAAFHFDSRDAFLAQACRALRPGGRLVMTDITFRRGYGDGIPEANIWQGEAEYVRRCEAAGLVLDRIEDITGRTLIPFYEHLRRHGQAAEAAIQRRVQAAYYFVVLHRPYS